MFKTAVKIRTWDKSCRTAAFFFCRRPAEHFISISQSYLFELSEYKNIHSDVPARNMVKYIIVNEEINEQEEQAENIDRFISKVRKYLDLDELTPAVLNGMIKAV